MALRILPLLLAIAPALFAAEPEIAILGYHQVEPVPKMGWSVSVEDFTDQMQFLAAAGYHVISIADLYDYISGTRASLPPNPVVITVDDGFEDAYAEIEPILKRFGYPWSLYVYPNFIGGISALKWPQVRELSAAGVDVEGHTMNHPHLMRKSHPEMTGDQYDAWLHNELAEGKRVLEQEIGKPVRFLAYPYGDYDEAVEKEAARDGYALALTSWAGFNTRKTPPFALRRTEMTSDTTLAVFARSVGAVPLELNDVSPVNETVGVPEVVSAVIVQAKELDPATVHIALLGESATGKYDPETGRITLTIGKYTRPRQGVIVYGDRASDHHPMATAWTYYTSAEAKTRYDAIAERLRELPLHHTQTKR